MTRRNEIALISRMHSSLQCREESYTYVRNPQALREYWISGPERVYGPLVRVTCTPDAEIVCKLFLASDLHKVKSAKIVPISLHFPRQKKDTPKDTPKHTKNSKTLRINNLGFPQCLLRSRRCRIRQAYLTSVRPYPQPPHVRLHPGLARFDKTLL